MIIIEVRSVPFSRSINEKLVVNEPDSAVKVGNKIYKTVVVVVGFFFFFFIRRFLQLYNNVLLGVKKLFYRSSPN